MALPLASLFIAIGALVPACGTYPAGGVAALEIAETRDDATRGTSRVRGPASFRLAGRDLIVTARFLRESARGTRRGDLFVVLSLPLPVTRGTYFRGAPLGLSGAYRETGIFGAEPESYELRGETRVEAAYGGPLRVAVDLDLGGPRRLALRGILASGESLPDGRLDLGGLDLEIWADGFDPFWPTKFRSTTSTPTRRSPSTSGRQRRRAPSRDRVLPWVRVATRREEPARRRARAPGTPTGTGTRPTATSTMPAPRTAPVATSGATHPPGAAGAPAPKPARAKAATRAPKLARAKAATSRPGTAPPATPTSRSSGAGRRARWRSSPPCSCLREGGGAHDCVEARDARRRASFSSIRPRWVPSQ